MLPDFVDVVNALWRSVKDSAALSAQLSELVENGHQPPSASAPLLPPWFPPLLFRYLSAEQLRCILPLPISDAPQSHVALVSALLRAVLLPMRAKVINPEVTMHLIVALGYSLDASSGVLALISGRDMSMC
jgi:hypothetical protein